MSIDALFAQKKKEKMMAKKQLQADTKNKRMAFKQQLEAQSPKVYVQEIVEKWSNRPFLSYCVPLCHTKFLSKTFHMKMTLIYTKMNL